MVNFNYDTNLLIVCVGLILLVAVAVMFACFRYYAWRSRKQEEEKHRQNIRLSLVLRTGRLRVWVYLPATRRYFFMSEKGVDEREVNPVEFSLMYERKGFEELRKAVLDICDNKYESAVVNLQSCDSEDMAPHHYTVNITVGQRNKQGMVAQVIGILHDVTEEDERRQLSNRLFMRYRTVFNSAMNDMMFYDRNGVLKDINEKACQTFGIKDSSTVLNGSFLLENNPMFNGMPFDQMENTRTSTIVDFNNYQDEKYKVNEFGLHGKMYYESTINPIRNANGELEGFYMAGRDITEMVVSFHHLQQSAKDLLKATNDIQEYINNINYALRVSDVHLVNYTPSKYTMEVSDSIIHTQMRLSQLRCIRLASPRYRRAVSSLLNRMDHLVAKPLELTIETEFRDKKGRTVWLMFNMVPLFDADGKVDRYFGMCRNMTDMVETEHRLAVETKKAQETELLKQSFLTNMSNEIRTPLSTVVNYAELFKQEHDVAEEPLFVEKIRESSNNLLKLINDVLLLSRLDANMIEYNKIDVDFALVFESHCQMGWSNVRPGVKVVVENPYDHLIVDIDLANLGSVIEKLCFEAANFTYEGTIRAKYEYRRGELTITVEDSGVGIDEKTLPHVFDRFVHNEKGEMCGTGLELPIIQSLVQQMGGTIEFQSQLGKGTTSWVTIPCEVKLMEKKGEQSTT